MPLTPLVPCRPVEYFIVHDATPRGPRLGRYADHEIAESIVDSFGRRYVYAGIAPRCWNGQFDVDALQPGEFILQPGLVYRLKVVKVRWWESLFRMQ
jgi:hypothetical protein